MRICIRFLLVELIAISIAGCSATPVTEQKINGVSFVSSKDTLMQSHIDPILNVGVSRAAVMPFAFVRDKNHPELQFNSERQWFGERYTGVKQYIEALHQNNIKVMVKPHIWNWRGVFTGDMQMDSEADWELFEKSYEDYILLYAALAEETHSELFCLGTELYNFTKERPEFWVSLIQKVRQVYSGNLTYAENWDKVDKVTFWGALDFIGVDAYFPVTDEATPTVVKAKEGWEPHKNLLISLSRKHNRPVLFTEFGYRSADYAGKEPWVSDRHDGKMNAKAQANLYEAVFETFWGEDWFAGGFVWKWFHNHERAIQEENNRFTPQGKEAEQVLKKWFKQDVK